MATIYYYKQIDILGKVLALFTCDTHLASSESQVEITEEEYNTLLRSMQNDVDETE